MASTPGLRVAHGGEVPFVGRAAEMAWLRRLLDRAWAGEPGVALVGGESGVGKSRLVREFLSEADERGAQTLWSRYAGGLQAPEEPFIAGLGAQATRAGMGLVPSSDAGRPDPRRLASELVRTASELANRRVLILAFDDLHQADALGLDLFRDFVAGIGDLGRIGRARLLVVATHQPVAPAAPISGSFERLFREPVCVGIEVTGLDEPGVSELLRLGLRGPCAASLVEAVSRATGGNPFFVLALASHLENEGALLERDGRLAPRSPMAELHLPATAVGSISGPLAGLEQGIVTLLRTAALLGDEFTADVLAAASGEFEPGAIDRAVAAGVLEEKHGRIGFAHQILRIAIEHAMGPEERAATHLRIAARLQDSPSLGSDARIAIALHLLAGGGGGTEPVALGRLYAEAADAAMEAYARSTAMRLYEACLANQEFVDSLASPDLGWLQCRAARANENDGNPLRARELYHKAIQNLRGSADFHAWGLAVVGWETSFTTTGEPIPSHTFEDEFFAAAGDSAIELRTRLTTQRADALQLARDPSDSRTAREAVALAERCESSEARAAAMATLGLVQMRHLEPRAALESFEAAADSASQLDNPVVRGWGRARRAWAHLVLGELDAAVRASEEATLEARSAHDWAHGALSLAFTHTASLLRGDLDAARDQQGECVRFVDRSRYVQARFLLDGAVAWHRMLRAEFVEALDAISAWEQSAGRLLSRPLRLLIECRAHGAEAVAGELDNQPLRLPVRDEPDFVSLGALGVAAELASDLRSERIAAEVLPALEFVLRHEVVFSMAPPVSLERAAATVCRVLGRFDEAARHLASAERHATSARAATESALTGIERARLLQAAGAASPMLARSLVDAAEACKRSGLLWPLTATRELAVAAGFTGAGASPGPVLPDEFSETEREVVAAFGQHLAPPEIADRLLLHVRTVEGHLDRVGRRLGIRTPEAAAAYLGGGRSAAAQARRHRRPLDELTPREREVLGLIAQGMTNQQIAEVLVISPHTAIRHVANILEKTGAPNRTAAARLGIAGQNSEV